MRAAKPAHASTTRPSPKLPRPALQVPVLAIGGDSGAGRGLEPGLSLQGFADNVTSEVIANCGHWLMEEQPAAVTRLLEAFADLVHAGWTPHTGET
ncbi:alpha/beta fold hydrolase [Kribbella sp. NPDC051586]|uniref:alpha/beta fold hydrolase n=1 Tax=Kribbella sp. NPDC051586 TaxID=3364118 RepID=UPI003791F02D